MIPPHAKRVFKGVIFDVYQWEQKMYDGSTTTFEALRRPDTVSVIATVGDKICILHQQQPDRIKPFISLPGGRANADEDPLEAAKRELLEETGYASEDWELYKVSSPVGKIDWKCYIYIARHCQRTAEPQLDAGEQIDLQFYSFDAFVNLVNVEDLRGLDLKIELLRAKYDSQSREDLQKRLFVEIQTKQSTL